MKIAENLGLRTIKAMIDAEAVELLVFQKFTRRHLKTLDARGRDSLGPQHHARQRLGIDARARKLKLRQSLLSIRHRACAGGAEKKLVIGKCVGKIRMVRASHALGLVHASTVGLTKAGSKWHLRPQYLRLCEDVGDHAIFAAIDSRELPSRVAHARVGVLEVF